MIFIKCTNSFYRMFRQRNVSIELAKAVGVRADTKFTIQLNDHLEKVTGK